MRVDDMRVDMDDQIKEQAALYALGVFPSSEAETMRVRYATNAVWQNETAAFAAVVGALALQPAALSPASGVREKLLARIAATPQEAPVAAPHHAAPVETPTFVTRFDEGHWMPLAPHVFCKVLHRDAASQMVTSLIKLEPGGYLPRHRHTGLEQSLIVSGDCIVNGATFYAGDFRICQPDTLDTAVTTQFGTTILMIAPEHFEILDAAWAH